jgi:hypothetical protein
MEVQNYTQNFAHFNALQNRYEIKQTGGSIAKRKLERMVRDAKRHYLCGFGIDWSQYGEPEVVFFDMITAQMEWTNKTTEQKIVLTSIWWDDKNGAIVQAGTNHGDLTL